MGSLAVTERPNSYFLLPAFRSGGCLASQNLIKQVKNRGKRNGATEPGNAKNVRRYAGLAESAESLLRLRRSGVRGKSACDLLSLSL